MRPALTLLAGPVLWAGLCHAALAQVMGEVSPRVQDLVGGIFCAPPDGERRPAPDTIAGWVHIPAAPVEMIANGNDVPAVLGLGFGVRFRLEGDSTATVRYTVTHPPIPPGNQTSQHWDSMLPGGGEDSAFFQFDTEDEMQPGPWGFSVEANGEHLFTMQFTVHPAADLPALAALCRGGALLSFSPETRAAAG